MNYGGVDSVHAGDQVLEVGAGSGRFTIELARLGALVTVTDVSGVQLGLNQAHVAEAGVADQIEARLQLDLREAATLGAERFDAVVAYGGPLSYVFDDAEDAFGHLIQVTRPGGFVLASVMAAVGSFRYFLPVVVDEIQQFGTAFYDHVLATGDLREIPGSHSCRMFRWSEVEAMISARPCHLVTASASNCLSLGDPQALERLAQDPTRWPWFLDWETALCRKPAVLEAGTHILFAVQREAPD